MWILKKWWIIAKYTPWIWISPQWFCGIFTCSFAIQATFNCSKAAIFIWAPQELLLVNRTVARTLESFIFKKDIRNKTT